MQAQDTTSVYLLKLWPWVEENRKSLIAGAVIVALVGFVFWFSSVQREQKQIAAGEAVTQAMLSPDGASAGPLLKVAAEHSGTIAGQRAWLQAATILFDQNNFTGSQQEFQKFLDTNPTSNLAPQAQLGLAACLDAQGKKDPAVAAYQRVIDTAPDAGTVNAAKFAVARIEESQGKFSEALNFYEAIARTDPNGSLGAEAYQHVMELQSRVAPKKPAATPASPSAPAAAPFQLSK